MLKPNEEKEFERLLRRIGRNMRVVRKEQRLSQEQISERLGIGLRNYQRMEHGRKAISTRNLFRIAARMGVSVERLVS